MKNFMFRTFILISLLSITLFPQAKYLGEIGNFNNASSFHINGAGFIFVTDAGNDKIYKLDTLGNMLKEAGGYGWDESSFDIPSDIFATTLNIYVSDEKNHRIQRFDKDLNFISSLSTRNSESNEQRFGYPLSCAVSNQGDLYVLDSENKRIIKFDLFGNFVQNFGGYDWGKYALHNPLRLAVDPANNVYCSDDNKVYVYDQFGNGIAIISSNENISGLNIIFSKLILNSGKNIYFADLSHSEFKLQQIQFLEPVTEEIVCSLIFNNNLYILTSKTIFIYDIGDLAK